MAEIAAALQSHLTLLVLGEPGTGRFTSTAELHHQAHKNGRSVALDAEEVNADPEGTITFLLTSSAVSTLYIIRDLERLTTATVARLLTTFDGAKPPPNVHLAATALPPRSDEPYQALLRHFDTSVTLPPLRHRGADVAQLVSAMLATLAPHRDVGLTHEATRAILRYEWPRNVQQLRQALEHALTKKPVGEIDVVDLPAFCQSAPRSSLSTLETVERDAIVQALRSSGGNRVEAAHALGVARSTLYRKIKHYGITN